MKSYLVFSKIYKKTTVAISKAHAILKTQKLMAYSTSCFFLLIENSS